MKKAAMFALFSAFMLVAVNGRCDTAAAGCWTTGPDAARHAHRAELIAEHKANPKSSSASTANETHVSKFWKNEAERSGVSGWKAPGFNPTGWFKEQDRKYKERKATAK